MGHAAWGMPQCIQSRLCIRRLQCGLGGVGCAGPRQLFPEPDTTGSGRVLAGFNHLVRLKPTLGLLSAQSVVPACCSLDTVSIFTLTAADAQQVLAEAHGFDASDTYFRSAQLHGFDFGVAAAPRIGIPRADQLQFLGDEGYAACFANALQHGQALPGNSQLHRQATRRRFPGHPANQPATAPRPVPPSPR